MLRGETTNLRAPERSDLERNLHWVNDRDVTEHLLLRYPMSEGSEGAWLETEVTRTPSPEGGSTFAIEIATGAHAGTYIGNCGLEPAGPLDRSAEFGITLGAAATGHSTAGRRDGATAGGADRTPSPAR